MENNVNIMMYTDGACKGNPGIGGWGVFIKYRYNEDTLSGTTAAFFGCGDQVGYADNFLDAIGLLGKPFMENGGKLIGRWPTEGYEFDNSLALDGDEFLGLGLDNDNEEELSEERLIIWAELIKDEFEL